MREIISVYDFVDKYIDDLKLSEYHKVLLGYMEGEKKLAIFYPKGAGKTTRTIAMQQLIIKAQQDYIKSLLKILKKGGDNEK